MNRSESSTPRALSVLNTSEKLEQLRAAGPVGRDSRRLAGQSVVDRALDATRSPRQQRLVEGVIDQLRTVYDPEIPVNVYDLGLIYSIEFDDQDRLKIRMTLTAPACPVADQLVREVEQKARLTPGVRDVRVELTFDPPWSREMMSEEAMLELGLL